MIGRKYRETWSSNGVRAFSVRASTRCQRCKWMSGTTTCHAVVAGGRSTLSERKVRTRFAGAIAVRKLAGSRQLPHRLQRSDNYPFHDKVVTVTTCGRICFNRQKINLSTVFAGQKVGIKQVSEEIWLVTFMDYDLGYFDHEACRLEPLDNPFGPKVLTPAPGIARSCTAHEAAREARPIAL
jgi:hypothetical protein